ncbi:hypothetical protein K5F93_12035 [Pseudomonas protegens]|uniref:hypothetical protein n=1 Tax=Pseudomonas protegens TaxID=380021 RepID=UPI001C8D99AF|nr:hypothetical protein [Pseudomonas protegens]QZI72928.1 hypothetical protein K5F93_12035 [Pseudomonas protegens]
MRGDLGEIGGSISAQTDLKAALDLKQDAASAPLTKRYTSPAQQFVAGGQFTLTHNLGKEVAVVEAWMRCKTAELGYSVGDKLLTRQWVLTTEVARVYQLSAHLPLQLLAWGQQFHHAAQNIADNDVFTAANWEIYLELLA